MMEGILIALYITVVAVLGLLVAREYARSKVRQSWQHHSAFNRELD